MELPLVIIYGLAVYRISRLIVLDTWISKTRKKVIEKIRDAYESNLNNRFRKFVFYKLFAVLTCLFCISVWVSLVWFARHLYYVDIVAHFFAVAAIPSIIADVRREKYVQVLEIDSSEARRQDADI